MKQHIIVENQRGLHIRKGLIVREVGPGVYREFRLANESYVIYSLAPTPYAVVDSYNTSDMASISAHVAVNIYIRDIRTYYLSGQSLIDQSSRVISKALQAKIERFSLAKLLDADIELPIDEVNDKLRESGLELAIEGPVVIRLPRNLQNAIDAQEVARQRAIADLEEARGRTAVLRHYANAAKMTKDNPELLKLLLGQKARSINVQFDSAP